VGSSGCFLICSQNGEQPLQHKQVRLASTGGGAGGRSSVQEGRPSKAGMVLEATTPHFR